MSTAGEQRKNPFKGKSIRPTFIIFGLCVLLSISARVYAAYRESVRAQEGVPRLALNSWVGDLQAFHKREGKFPVSLVELENVIWRTRRTNGKGNDKNSVLQNGDRIYVRDNYMYVYTRDENDQLCSVWAVPIGQKREGANTVFVLISPTSVEQWRGGALPDDQFKFIPKKAIPTYEQMAYLGLSKQQARLVETKKRGLGQLLPF